MFAYELPINPPCDVWEEYQLPELCKSRIQDLCEDILKRGERTRFNRIYDTLYQLIREEIEEEYFEGYIL